MSKIELTAKEKMLIVSIGTVFDEAEKLGVEANRMYLDVENTAGSVQEQIKKRMVGELEAKIKTLPTKNAKGDTLKYHIVKRGKLKYFRTGKSSYPISVSQYGIDKEVVKSPSKKLPPIVNDLAKLADKYGFRLQAKPKPKKHFSVS